jgi:acyl-coenzyme A thioesterase PaaI-like protein
MVAPLSTGPAVGTELPQHYAGCFGCGDHPAGPAMRFRVVAPGTVACDLRLARHHQGAPGIAHGGLVTAVFDEAMGATQVFVEGRAVTATLSTDFRRPVPVESPLHVVARLDERDGRKLRTSAELRLGDADGPVAATARALFLTVPDEHFARYAG